MNATATTLSDVVVTNEQTRVQWRAGRASIDRGLIVLAPKSDPPPGLLDRTASTYTITAVDGGGRSRCFPSVVVDRAGSEPPARIAFS